ncbi:putative palmitoyltransferase [Diplogelasinospora grovesii]|uniref:Palmitoyltransferase n=1 Tax=Diplogelasinospora grovesii TaxID=303347 RepID=A0AAN6S840_9PEZI|nr:putative palmitoyltransferase [Diplogelasinospora grovesii]
MARMAVAGAVESPTLWATRVIPLILAGCVGYATYVVPKRICIDYFLHTRQQPGVAIAFLVLYCTLMCLMLITYLRVFLVIQYNPGVVPLGAGVIESRARPKKRKKACGRGQELDDLEANSGRYESKPDPNPDSPGLERYYSKDVFVCASDGRPKWCSHCGNWKPDRAHHSSEIGRCVRKMDHYCPWVGGIVSETSFKFFLQFVFYATLYCLVVLAAGALSLSLSIRSGSGADGFVIGVLAIGGFFGLFAFAMTLTGMRYVLINLTNIDDLQAKFMVYQLAIRVPRDTPPGEKYGIITYPLPKPESRKYESGNDSGTHLSGSTSEGNELVSARDALATRTFAIVKTEMGENPWHLGLYGNWKSVMGSNVFDWLLPIRQSPCVTYENNESFYEMGPLCRELRTRYGLPEISDENVRSEKQASEKMPRDREAHASRAP